MSYIVQPLLPKKGKKWQWCFATTTKVGELRKTCLLYSSDGFYLLTTHLLRPVLHQIGRIRIENLYLGARPRFSCLLRIRPFIACYSATYFTESTFPLPSLSLSLSLSLTSPYFSCPAALGKNFWCDASAYQKLMKNGSSSRLALYPEHRR